MIEFAKDEGIDFNEKQYNESKKTIEIRLKANIAQDLYDYKNSMKLLMN